MQKLDDTIINYLTKETSHSILITGPWGSGKTYYVKNNLFKEIKKTPTISDNTKKYIPLHISLFGLESIDEIKTEIFLSVYPILKSSKLKLILGVGKTVLKGIMFSKGLGNIDDYLVDTKTIKDAAKNVLRYDQLVIVMDDLERRNPKLELQLIMGFINNLVENENLKVIIIANEKEMDEENLYKLKEKTISNTIEFNPDFDERLLDIINTRYGKGNSMVFREDCIQKNLALLKLLLKFSENNFRKVIFALDNLHDIYSIFRKSIVDISSVSHYKIEEKEDAIIRFTIAISIEFKKGTIDYHNRNGIDIVGLPLSEIFQTNSSTRTNPQTELFKDDFRAKYLNMNQILFFPSIFNYITANDHILEASFINDISRYFKEEKDYKSNEDKIFDELSYYNYFKLTASNYRKKTHQLIKSAIKGKFNIEMYLTLFYYSCRFEYVIKGERKEKLKNQFITAIKKNNNFELMPTFQLDSYLSIEADNPLKEYFTPIAESIRKRHKELTNTYYKGKREAIFSDFLRNKIEFFENAFSSDTDKNEIIQTFIMKGPERLFQAIRKFTPENLETFRAFLLKSNWLDYANNDKTYLIQLLSLVDLHTSKIKNQYYVSFWKKLTETIDKISSSTI